ncbi:hypothetical protein [Bradyrhizobium sp. CCBAU 051011]|uniref:hypothetical protein n=1 Tax=Bradyrhizobium sp. CCBAU 051011 TaxID=858422 RepID=UPI00137AC987|nr:hypothetical protein [Bradyrhizobium sp. CCBAU 051011]
MHADARRRLPSFPTATRCYGFTNPAADGSMLRTTLYNEQADRRSWASMKSLFDEVLT